MDALISRASSHAAARRARHPPRSGLPARPAPQAGGGRVTTARDLWGRPGLSSSIPPGNLWNASAKPCGPLAGSMRDVVFRPESELSAFKARGRRAGAAFAELSQCSHGGAGRQPLVERRVRRHPSRPRSRRGASGEQAAPRCRAEQRRGAAARSTGALWTSIRSTGPPARGARGLQVDLGGIAKGYGVDAVAKSLDGPRRRALHDRSRRRGCAPGAERASQPWQIRHRGARRDTAAGAPHRPAVGRAMATSGDYRIYFEEGGRRYSHEIDPTTAARSPTGGAVTVVADDCMRADGLARR